MNHFNNQHIQQQNMQFGNSQVVQLQMVQQQNLQSNTFQRQALPSSRNGQIILRLEKVQQPFQPDFFQSQQFSSNIIQQTPSILSNIQIQDPTLNYIEQQNMQPDNFQQRLTTNNFQGEQQQFPLYDNFQQRNFITDKNFQQQQFTAYNFFEQQLTSNINYQQPPLTDHINQQQQLPTSSNYQQQNSSSTIVDISAPVSSTDTNIVATDTKKKKGLDRSKDF